MFVTTGVVSTRAQTEVFEDRYPLVMISALGVATAVRQMLHKAGHNDLGKLLAAFDERHELSPRVMDAERLVV